MVQVIQFMASIYLDHSLGVQILLFSKATFNFKTLYLSYRYLYSVLQLPLKAIHSNGIGVCLYKA